MALDAGVAGLDIAQVRGIQNISAGWMLDVLAAGAVATFAADVPLGDLFCVDVVADGMAAIAGGAGGPLHVVGGIECGPPVGAVGNEIGPPDFVGDIPLRGLRVIVVADFCEVALLPHAAVDEGDLVLGELGDFVCRKVGDDDVRGVARIANDVGHRSFAPVLVDLRVAFLAGGRAGEVSRAYGRGLLCALFLGQ